MTFRRVLGRDDLWPGEMRGVLVDGRKVLFVNVDGSIRAFEDRCAHQAVQLSKGRLEGCVLTCSAHEWTYDVRTCEGINPRAARLVPYPVKVEGTDVFVDVEARADEASWVGPVLHGGAASRAVLTALVEENPEAKIVDRGAYVRVLAPRQCRLSREVIERHSNAPFRFPGDLELIMVSFKGRLRIADDIAYWELGGEA